MPVTVHSIDWKATYLRVKYKVDAKRDDRLCLYNEATHRLIPFNVLSKGEYSVAELNVTVAGGREVLSAGNWKIIALPFSSLRKYANTPLPLNAEAKVLYEDKVLLELENKDRIFRYGGGKYAYTISLIPKLENNVILNVTVIVSFYRINPNPHRRSNSLRQIEKDVFSLLYRMLAHVIHPKKNQILFLKENGTEPTQNMKSVQNRMYERNMNETFKIVERYRNVFSGRQHPIDWLLDLLYIARSKYIFVDDYTPIFNFISPTKQTVLTQIWHAGVGFKSVGYARFGLTGSPDPYNSSHRKYTYALVGNKYLRQIYSEVFGIEQEALLATGMPRLDHFFDRQTEITRQLSKKYMWSQKGRVIVFAPTFRGSGQREAFYPYQWLDLDEIYQLCVSTDSFFVFKMHHFIKEQPIIPPKYAQRIFNLTQEELNDLFFITDVLITDYSSCFYDYILLKKPVIFFTPDKLAYSLIRGVQRPIDEMAPGIICNTFSELLSTIENNLYETYSPHPSSIDRAIERSGLASDRVIDTVIYHKEVQGVRLKTYDNES
ncbi:CDP-glycerol glycerophosphotransferase family protein [uncultured Bifidobacterium sp.]|uniref:CDP-glycerol glycerophosphotransferase family protein n=1 Tax=uncultured Bifidobacterium sp. TaxID=165187 RepID=UPI002588ABD6|nr:CDP-glycerol glycerophosphotransferase family protein [uncultured Bifidobacterium sp.]